MSLSCLSSSSSVRLSAVACVGRARMNSPTAGAKCWSVASTRALLDHGTLSTSRSRGMKKGGGAATAAAAAEGGGEGEDVEAAGGAGPR